jgi:hypothetical protein
MNITNKIDMYLNEAKIETIEEFTELVKRDCSKFLKEIKQSKRFVYRGISGVGKMGIKTPRINREPKDTSLAGHKYLGNLFKKHHGWNARKEGVFCFGNPEWAGDYGITYIIFPVNGYKYVWSDYITDLTVYVQDDYNFSYDGEHATFSVLWSDIRLNAFVDYIMNNYDEDEKPDYERIEGDIIDQAEKELSNDIKKYHKNDLNKAITNYHEHEISLKCKKYYYISWNIEIESELKRLLYK